MRPTPHVSRRTNELAPCRPTLTPVGQGYCRVGRVIENCQL